MPRVNPSNEVLVVAAAALAVCAASLTGFGLRRQRYRGWLWWVAALWLTTLGASLAAASSTPAARAAADLLLMQWPIVTLLGLRRFHARPLLPGDEGLDLALLVAAGTLALAGAAGGEPLATWASSACALVLHLYAAVVLLRGPDSPDALPLQALAASLALVAFAPLLGHRPLPSLS